MARYGHFASGNPDTCRVNLYQTPEERRAKYNLVRSFGINSYWAMGMRDWRLTSIEKRLRAWHYLPDNERLVLR